MCPHPTLGWQGSGLCRRPQNRAVIPASYCKRRFGLACFPAVVRLTAAGDLSQPRQHIEQKACRQQEHGSSLLLSQDSVCDLLSLGLSMSKPKPSLKMRNALGTRCSTGSKTFWVNILQRAQIISLQTLGMCIYLNIYKIWLFLDNRFILQKKRNPAD